MSAAAEKRSFETDMFQERMDHGWGSSCLSTEGAVVVESRGRQSWSDKVHDIGGL